MAGNCWLHAVAMNIQVNVALHDHVLHCETGKFIQPRVVQVLPLNKIGYILTFRAGLLRCYNVQVGGGGCVFRLSEGFIKA